MSSTQTSNETETKPALTLTPVLSERWQWRAVQLVVVVYFSVYFMHHNYTPLFHSDLWGHVAYGEWILEHRSLPTEEPFVELAEGVPVVCTAWLGQVTLAEIVRLGGDEWLSNAFALTALLTALVLCRVFYRQVGQLGLAAFGTFLVWIVGWSRHAIIRPENFGTLFFAVLLLLVTRIPRDPNAPRGKFFWVLLPVLFTLWANVHGSFVVGFAVIGCIWLGRVIEVAWQTGGQNVWRDPLVRFWLYAGEVAVLATLVNPYGLDLLIHTVMFPSNPNLNDVLEWHRLQMLSFVGLSVGFSWVLMLVTLRHSRQPVRPADVLLLCVFTAAVCLRIRMVSWYAPIVIWVLVPHLADVAEQLKQLAAEKDWFPRVQEILAVRSFRYTVFSGLVVWIAFAFSPISRDVLGGTPRSNKHLYSADTPHGLTQHLHENPPRGLVANPQWWGDWLALRGPSDLRVFMSTNAVHVAPRRVWLDYLLFAEGRSNIDATMERYRINTIIVSKSLQAPLLNSLKRMQNQWQITYEDDTGVVFRRKRTLKTDTESTEATESNGPAIAERSPASTRGEQE